MAAVRNSYLEGLILCAAMAISPQAWASELVTRTLADFSIEARAAGTSSAGEFGERVNPQSGALSFRHTDVHLPGQGPEIRIERSFDLVERMPFFWQRKAHLADWRLELPRISTELPLHPQLHIDKPVAGEPFARWHVRGPAAESRCSAFAPPPDAVADYGQPRAYPAEGWWRGVQLHVPGEDPREVLVGLAGAQAPAMSIPGTKGGFPLATRDRWRITCLSSLKNGHGGEGFLAVAPDGMKYWFDWLVFEGHSKLDGRFRGTTASLLATRVEDRFGNAVDYVYEGNVPVEIRGSDGRHLRLAWRHHSEGSFDAFSYLESIVVQPDDAFPRTWRYHYEAARGIGSWASDGVLRAVERPDGSRWSLRIDAFTGPCRWQSHFEPCTNYAFNSAFETTGSMTSPGGATAMFTTRGGLHERTHEDHALQVGERDYDPYLAQVPQLASKTVDGVGLESRTWTYRNERYGHFAHHVALEPDGSARTTVSWNRWRDGMEGQVTARFVHADHARTQLLREEQLTYGSPIRMGTALRAHVGTGALEYHFPLARVLTKQQDVEFEYLVQGADAFGRPLIVKRSSRNAGAGTTNYARTDHIAYEDNHAVWVLGQERQSTNADTGLIERRTIFDARAQPTHRHAFEKLQQVLTYDAWGNLATASDGRDSPDVDTTIVYSQWKRGIPQRITFPDGYTRNAVVDAHGQVRSIDDEVGNRTCYDFDAMGRLKQITYPSDTQLHVCDDSRWNASVRKIEKASASEVGLPAGHWKETTTTGTGVHVTRYDALWRPVVVERFDSDDKPGTLTQTVRRYTANGQVAFESYPLRGMTQYTSVGTGTRTTFDALGRATRVEQDSDEGPLLTRYAYQAGFITEATRPDGRVTRTGYQAYDKPSTELVRAIVYPEGIASDIPRDVFGKPAYITRRSLDHSQSMVRTYAYNPAQELCRTVEPETGATLVGYDAAGNVAWSASGLPGATPCEPEGTSPSVVARRSERRYDGRNRLVELTFADDIGEQRWAYTPDGLPSGAWTYNGAGRTELVYNAWSYNSRRLLGGAGETLHEPGWTWALGYGYDRNGSMTVRYNPDTSSHLFTVNGLGQVIGIRGTSGNYVSDARYHPNGALQRFTYGNGIAHTTEQNTRGMPDRTRDAHGAVAVIDDGYDYDLVGNVVAISDGASGRNQRGNRTMAYDGLDRLTAVSSPMFTAARYEYDVFDNLKRVTIGGTFGRDHYYCHDANNRLTNIKTMGCGSGASVVGLGHDVQGNVRNKNGVQYVFSHDNRLREVVGKESYHYDARGLRSTAESATLGKTRSFYNKAGQVAFQSDGRRQVSLANVYLAGRLVATCEQSLVTTVATMKYLHTDALGTPVAVTDAAGNVVERSEYEPYGRLLNRPIQDGVGYTGHVEDAQTGLTHMQQRYYDPAGVFLSVDPVAASSTNGMNFNRYWYANNNPYRYIDPDGRVSDDPDRQARGGLSVGQATSPAADKVVSDRGGAPTGKLAVQMESTDPKDRLAIAKTAMATGQINGDPETLSYNPDLQGIASGTTDPSGAVEVGPDAFVSWSWLESTLGHEYEIHVPQFQNFGPIRSDRDNSRREAEAHQYNLNNAARFRNTPGEIQRYQELLQQDKGG